MEEDQNIEQSQEDRKSESEEEVNENISQERFIEQLKTKNMEVHHHPDLHQRKKHWKEYFLEGIMIFIAVTLGFFAESYREYLADRTKEKEYIQNIVEDLIEDTTRLNNCIQANNFPQNGRDTLCRLLYNYQPETNINELARLYIMYCFSYNLVRLTDHTIAELKTSGNMQLIKNQSVVQSSILSYDDKIHFTEKQGDITLDFGVKNVNYGNGILNIQQLLPFIQKGPSVFRDTNSSISKSKKVFTKNLSPQLLLQFANSLELYIGVCNDYIYQMTETKKETIDLITIIRRKYHLNNG